VLFCAGLLSADTIVFTPVSSGVHYSVNNPSGFFVSSSPITGAVASADVAGSNFRLSATDPSYSDAGIVLFLNGGLTLGELQSVIVATTDPSAISINVWMDTGGDGQFFVFDSNGLLISLNGDTYTSTSTTSLDAASSLYVQGGNGAGGTYSLQQLEDGVVSGINGSTPTAIWVGITNIHTADISSIDVNLNTTPEPGSVLLIGGGLICISMAFRRKRV
jgi:hypothetical protein